MEWMKKVYKNVGDGMLELCNTSYSIAQAMNLKKVCYCDECIERLGREELDRRSKVREDKIKRMDFESLKKLFERITEWDEDEYCPFDNWYRDSVDEDGNRYLLYSTGGDLEFMVTRQEQEYVFEIIPPKDYFRSGSTLYRTLLGAGYELNSDWEHKISHTKFKISNPYYDRAECMVCGEEVLDGSIARYCPHCGRETDGFVQCDD